MHRSRIERTASKRWRGSVRRVISATIYNLSCFTHGCSTGWVSGVLGAEALAGGAWLAALPCLVALPAAPFFAVLADAKGRKAGAFCISASFLVSWSMLWWGGPRTVWAARAAAGAGGAGALSLAPLYCAEIAPRNRGLASMPALACSCGVLFAFLAGSALSAHALALWLAAPSAVLLAALFWLPETPGYLISVGRMQDAAKVMCWFDGSDFRQDLTDVIEQQEVRIRTSDGYGRRDLRRQDSDAFQPMLKRSSGLDSNSDRRAEPSACRELFRHRRSRRALLSCCVLLGAAAGSGAGAVNSFAAAVLQHSAHAIPRLNATVYNFTVYNGTVSRGTFFAPSELGAVACGVALVLGAAVALCTVDKLGRKMLLLWSCSGIACCLAILGVYCDPRLRMHSWYNHRLWPYKRPITFKEKLTENLISNVSFDDNFRNYSDEVSLKSYADDDLKVWQAVGDVNVTDDGLWKKEPVKNVTDNEVSILLPIVVLSMVQFLYNTGLGSVPFVLISELFTVNVRSLASSLIISWMWLSNFLLLRYYGTFAASLGLHSMYYIGASFTLVGSLYTYFFLPETKGKSQPQIDESLEQFSFRRRRKHEGNR